MKSIFCTPNDWLLGGPGGLVSTGDPPANEPPVTGDDASVAVQGQTVVLSVLVNDYDPEGGTLTVVAASATTGAVLIEDGERLIYTAPLDFVGDDVISYSVVDGEGLTTDGSVTVTVQPSALDVIDEGDGTVTLSANDGDLSITVFEPAALAGTTSFNTGDVETGPVSLAAPTIEGSPGLGLTLTGQRGLWVSDTGDGDVNIAHQWIRDGVEIVGATAPEYLIAASDLGTQIGLREIATNVAGLRSSSASEMMIPIA